MVDIPKTYGLILRKEWMKFLTRWFSTDFTELWLPRKMVEQSNQDRCKAKVKNNDYRIQCSK